MQNVCSTSHLWWAKIASMSGTQSSWLQRVWPSRWRLRGWAVPGFVCGFDLHFFLKNKICCELSYWKGKRREWRIKQRANECIICKKLITQSLPLWDFDGIPANYLIRIISQSTHKETRRWPPAGLRILLFMVIAIWILTHTWMSQRPCQFFLMWE